MHLIQIHFKVFRHLICKMYFIRIYDVEILFFLFFLFILHSLSLFFSHRSSNTKFVVQFFTTKTNYYAVLHLWWYFSRCSSEPRWIEHEKKKKKKRSSILRLRAILCYEHKMRFNRWFPSLYFFFILLLFLSLFRCLSELRSSVKSFLMYKVVIHYWHIRCIWR